MIFVCNDTDSRPGDHRVFTVLLIDRASEIEAWEGKKQRPIVLLFLYGVALSHRLLSQIVNHTLLKSYGYQ